MPWAARGAKRARWGAFGGLFGLWLGLGWMLHSASALADDTDTKIAQLQTHVKSVEEQLRLVEEGFVARLQDNSEQTTEERFGEAEIAFLIGDFAKATSLLYDVVLSPGFRHGNRYYDGVFYLGESLLQQKDYLGSKHFLRQLLDAGRGTPHFEEALVSYLELAARTNDFRDLDRFTELAEHSGRVAPSVEYLLAKATFERSDLADEERVKRSQVAFGKLGPESPFYLQALYFLGVCHVQLGELNEALADFAKVQTAAHATDSGTKALHELAWLAVGRVNYELGKYGDALDAYQNIPETSDSFYDALYEIAWTYVKRGDFESARKSVELLTPPLGPPNALPEAKLLQGQLLLKLGKYSESEDTYRQVVGKYGPVRDQIDQLLAINGDPAAYFDRLLAEKKGAFDVASLLPPAARPWAVAQKSIKEAQVVAQDLGDGRRGISESEAIAKVIDKRMQDAASLEAFPALQAGFERAGAVDAALLQDEKQLVAMDQSVLSSAMTPGDQASLRELESRRNQLETQFSNLPKNETQVKGRDEQRLGLLRDKEKELFKLSLLVQSLRAQSVAVQRLAEETKGQRTSTKADEQKFADDVAAVLAQVEFYDAQVSELRHGLKEAETVDTGTGGQRDESLRAAYAQALQQEADLLSGVRGRASPGAAAQSEQIRALREQIVQQRSRCANAEAQIRQAAVQRAELIRQKLAIETQNLDGYRQEVAAAEGRASGLVGKIAYESFRRVRRQVYDLVLKADVGIIDVAWTRKHDDADKIQKLASDKDREVRVLDDDFHEVLEEVH